MNDKSDRPMVGVAIFTAVMLLMVFIGESIPMVVRTIVYAVCVAGIMGVLALKNLLSSESAAVFRKFFGVGYLIFGGILISVILLDISFVPGDSLPLGMEPATAMAVFGVTFFPFIFIILWLVGFERVIVTPEKEKHLKGLVEKGEDQPNG
jgi:hypothetical protein